MSGLQVSREQHGKSVSSLLKMLLRYYSNIPVLKTLFSDTLDRFPTRSRFKEPPPHMERVQTHHTDFGSTVAHEIGPLSASRTVPSIPPASTLKNFPPRTEVSLWETKLN